MTNSSVARVEHERNVLQLENQQLQQQLNELLQISSGEGSAAQKVSSGAYLQDQDFEPYFMHSRHERRVHVDAGLHLDAQPRQASTFLLTGPLAPGLRAPTFI